MNQYEPQTFDLPPLEGISQKQIDTHLKLYEGYVKHVNVIKEQVTNLHENNDDTAYAESELWRRMGFEFNGMRAHEYYFGALEKGSVEFDANSSVGKALVDQFGSYETFAKALKNLGLTRGSGWANVYFDQKKGWFVMSWADEHHIGQLASLPVLLALDCWEHAYMIDHDTTGRGTYIEAYLSNINWDIINQWFEAITIK